ncbi:hypothetical protein [Flavisolibacter tropicus]|uniref:Uncharacterized protein n=1 Tax=Flavisolibacter tropicus TaxID=1492898 RepID=A0A172U1T9_9BACT|nr:hypothetical protein [Flavisolibacter tropicus]ANE52993.1 hypothetical protein SY85_23465 [Flavisolibacter tropicus]
MQRDKQPSNEENLDLRLVQEHLNLREYAGDSEDDQLTRDQANEYITDCDRKLMGRARPEDNNSKNMRG